MKPALLTAAQIKKVIPRRPGDAHKGSNGHVLVIAGSRGMSGAAVLTALGALRIGAGLVTAAIVESERSAVTHGIPEALTLSLPESSEGALNENALPILRDYIERRRISVLAIGPGLSVNPSVANVVKALLEEWDKPLILDADGLNNLTVQDVADHPDVIITPHAGELARLMRVETDTVQRERVRVAENLSRDNNLLCVLKGSHTVITNGRTTRLNPTGNPAMATGGMGDVLTGAIAGLLAQGLDPWDAACAGVYLHGLAGDLARVSDRGLLATDVAHALPRALVKIGVK